MPSPTSTAALSTDALQHVSVTTPTVHKAAPTTVRSRGRFEKTKKPSTATHAGDAPGPRAAAWLAGANCRPQIEARHPCALKQCERKALQPDLAANCSEMQ